MTDYLDTDGAAEVLDVKPSTLRSWRKRKQGPPYTRIGASVRYDKSELDDWYAAQRVDPNEVSDDG